MKQVRCSPKSAILPSVIGNTDNPLPIRSSDWHTFFFLLGVVVARFKKKKEGAKALQGSNPQFEVELIERGNM